MESIDTLPEVAAYYDYNHTLGSQLLLDENFVGVDSPAGFRNLQLMPHQSSVVKALMDIEDRRVITVRTDDYEDLTNGEVMVETSGMVLSEPFGSGKTFQILGLIMLRPVPKAFPYYANSICTKLSAAKRLDRYRRYQEPTEHLFKHEIIKRFTGPDALIRPNLIIVGSSVLVQWEQAIKEFTNLKVFVIGDYYKLVKFYDMYKAGKIHGFDVILLKNGTFTGNFVMPGDKDTARDYRGLVSTVGKITANSCWSRVIYDDFDTIAIPAGTTAINALFTVYVSATTKQEANTKKPTIVYNSLVEAFKERNTPLNLVVRDNVLFTNFNVRNTTEFVEASTKITRINGFRYVYANPDDNYIRLIGAMGEEDANNIMEMLNGDAIGTAAEAMGIKTTSVADIFQKMLDKKYEKYLHDQYVLETIDKVRANIFPELEEHPEGKKHSNVELDAIRSQITKKNLPKIGYYSRELEQMIDELYAEFTAAKEQDGIAINRVCENLKDGNCAVCCLELRDFDVFIVKCCGLIVCDVCGIKGNQIQKRYDYKTKTQTICGSCANCKATIYPQTDLLFVDKDFDMDALLKAKGDEKPAEAFVEEVVEDIEEDLTPKEPEIKNPKLKALKAIVLGTTPELQESIPINIPHLLEGRVDNPNLDLDPRKVVVFANFNETLNLIEEFLVEQKITFLRLGGTFHEKAATVKKFKTYGQVLLINSSQNCAGINAQFMTDLVYFHKLTDKNIESQVAGRGQRIGRLFNLRIHYLAYKNEKDLI